jgi:hypothetical protein
MRSLGLEERGWMGRRSINQGGHEKPPPATYLPTSAIMRFPVEVGYPAPNHLERQLVRMEWRDLLLRIDWKS